MSAAPVTAWQTVTALLPHQQEAVAKLLPSRVGALFAEMGTGKSRIAIELAYLRQAKIDRVLWFCPVSAKETIRREIIKHANARPSDIHVFDAKTAEHNLPPARWHIIGTESIGGSARVYLSARALITERTLVILDESHQIKGHRAKRTERLTHICATARYRLILTGTPISQGIVDLFAQMRFLSPRILGYRSFYTFQRNHIVYSEKYHGLIERETNKDYLAAKIKPYVYQITKDECLTLPAKLYSNRYTLLSLEQARAYDEAKDRILTEDYLLGDDWERVIAIFQLFTTLQCIVCGFERLADGSIVRYPHERMDALSGILARIPAHERVVIWAKYHASIDEITAALSAQHGADQVNRYDGRLNERQRHRSLERWRAHGRYLIATQAAGGQSIDLTAAAYVVYYANSFKYSERQQSEDRCHRIGQERPVTYIDLWTNSGIDERIERALARKSNAVDDWRREVQKVRKTKKEKIRELVKSL
jgi:SNF2 family DNA or RNA helicase